MPKCSYLIVVRTSDRISWTGKHWSHDQIVSIVSIEMPDFSDDDRTPFSQAHRDWLQETLRSSPRSYYTLPTPNHQPLFCSLLEAVRAEGVLHRRVGEHEVCVWQDAQALEWHRDYPQGVIQGKGVQLKAWNSWQSTGDLFGKASWRVTWKFKQVQVRLRFYYYLHDQVVSSTMSYINKFNSHYMHLAAFDSTTVPSKPETQLTGQNDVGHAVSFHTAVTLALVLTVEKLLVTRVLEVEGHPVEVGPLVSFACRRSWSQAVVEGQAFYLRLHVELQTRKHKS